jgi:hypothetical protein
VYLATSIRYTRKEKQRYFTCQNASDKANALKKKKSKSSLPRKERLNKKSEMNSESLLR